MMMSAGTGRGRAFVGVVRKEDGGQWECHSPSMPTPGLGQGQYLIEGSQQP